MYKAQFKIRRSPSENIWMDSWQDFVVVGSQQYVKEFLRRKAEAMESLKAVGFDPRLQAYKVIKIDENPDGLHDFYSIIADA